MMVLPATVREPPMNTLPEIPAPPATVRAPVVLLVEGVVLEIPKAKFAVLIYVKPIKSTTSPATSNTTGAVIVAGGLGVAGNVYGGTVYSNGADVIGTALAFSIALG